MHICILNDSSVSFCNIRNCVGNATDMRSVFLVQHTLNRPGKRKHFTTLGSQKRGLKFLRPCYSTARLAKEPGRGWVRGVGGGGGGLRCPGYHATTCSERVLAGTCCVIKDRFLRVSQVRPSAHSGAVVGSDFVTSVCRTCNRHRHRK